MLDLIFYELCHPSTDTYSFHRFSLTLSKYRINHLSIQVSENEESLSPTLPKPQHSQKTSQTTTPTSVVDNIVDMQGSISQQNPTIVNSEADVSISSINPSSLLSMTQSQTGTEANVVPLEDKSEEKVSTETVEEVFFFIVCCTVRQR